MDAVGFGALNYDRLYRVKKLAKAGSHEPILAAFEGPGGSAANTTAHLAALGRRTGFIGAVGMDAEGEAILADFEKRRVDAARVMRVPERTGVIVGFVDEKGERTLYPNPGANNRVFLSKQDFAYASKAKLLHMSSFVSEKQFRGQVKLARALEKTVLSFAPGDLYCEKGLGGLAPTLAKTKVLFLNESELSALSRFRGRMEALARVHKIGVETIALTLGARGCVVSKGGVKTIVPAKKVKAVDTTGAGDAFVAGFLNAMLSKKSPLECGRAGNALAAKKIRKKGAR